ncbi:MAG: hypothetical protein CVV30_10190 [Methanomicrobiales archaeon HGW-Methanomicrobiales-1]|nr:MAG: hypothetical protein CVV30_10190 [Methanomicrobiales archaeon HGW-Methanomicrobiales-1]
MRAHKQAFLRGGSSSLKEAESYPSSCPNGGGIYRGGSVRSLFVINTIHANMKNVKRAVKKKKFWLCFFSNR